MDYYNTLGVPHNASHAVIRAAYRSLALRYHPDRAGAASAQRFREIQQAYETLSVPSRRQAYDISLRRPARQIPVTVIEPTTANWHGSVPEPLRPPMEVAGHHV